MANALDRAVAADCYTALAAVVTSGVSHERYFVADTAVVKASLPKLAGPARIRIHLPRGARFDPVHRCRQILHSSCTSQ